MEHGWLERRLRALGSPAGVALIVVVCLAVAGGAVAMARIGNPFGQYRVGQTVNGRVLLASNQWIAPLGSRILVDNSNGNTNVRLVSSMLSPDGTKLAALSWNEFSGSLTIIDLTSHKVLQQVAVSGLGGYDPTGRTRRPLLLA